MRSSTHRSGGCVTLTRRSSTTTVQMDVRHRRGYRSRRPAVRLQPLLSWRPLPRQNHQEEPASGLAILQGYRGCLRRNHRNSQRTGRRHRRTGRRCRGQNCRSSSACLQHRWVNILQLPLREARRFTPSARRGISKNSEASLEFQAVVCLSAGGCPTAMLTSRRHRQWPRPKAPTALPQQWKIEGDGGLDYSPSIPPQQAAVRDRGQLFSGVDTAYRQGKNRHHRTQRDTRRRLRRLRKIRIYQRRGSQ